MKTNLLLLKNSVLLGVVFFMLNNGTVLLAQTEIKVDPGFNTILDAIAAHPGATLVLKRGADYVNDTELAITVPTIIKGEKLPADFSPAVMTFFANEGQAATKYMFSVSSTLVLSNVGCMGICYDDQQVKSLFNVVTNDVSITMDGCSLQGFTKTVNTNGKAGLTMMIKNCQFHNMAIKGWDSLGGIVGGEWQGARCNFTATNNTYFVTSRGHAISGAGPDGSVLINHNTYVVTWGYSFFPNSQSNVTIKNNLFYDSFISGYVGKRLAADQSVLWAGDYSDWKADSLCGDVPIYPHAADSTGDMSNRKVQVSNNLKAYSKHVLDFQTANRVATMPFFNHTDRVRYAPRYKWDFSKNLLWEDGKSVDPQFAGGTIPDAAYEMMFKQRIERSLPASMQGPGFPYYLAWIPEGKTIHDFIWPLPINLKPTNPAILTPAGDDGYPLGDLNWFGAGVMADWNTCCPCYRCTGIDKVKSVDLNLKNYPNPFSSSTLISYILPVQEKVSLMVFNAAGVKVATLVNATQDAGNHEVTFNSANLPGGLYFYQIQVGDNSQFQKMIVAK